MYHQNGIGSLGLASLLASVLVVGCQPSKPFITTPSVSPSSPSPASFSANPAAKIVEIHKQPVFVRSSQQAQEIAGQEGMGVHIGETIRTQKPAMAQIDLKNGLAFRIGGDSVMTLQPNNRLNLTAGNMITWVQPGQKVPTQIVTPAAIAGIRGTTVYIEIPKAPNNEILFFAWEGAVAIRLPNQTEEMVLKTGEEVRIKPGERDMGKVRRRVRRLKRAEWRAKLRNDHMLHGFKRRLPTMTLMEKLKPGQVTLTDPAP